MTENLGSDQGANDRHEYEIAKLEAYREEILAKREAEVAANDRPQQLDEEAAWLMYTDSERDASQLRRAYEVGLRSKRGFGLPGQTLPPPAATQILVGFLLGDGGLYASGITRLEEETVAEKLSMTDGSFGYTSHIDDHHGLVEALVLAGRADLLNDFAGVRDVRNHMRPLAARLWASKLNQDLKAYDAARGDALRLEEDRFPMYEVVGYPHCIREYADLLLPLGEHEIIRNSLQHSNLDSGEVAVMLFEYLWRYSRAEHGSYSVDELVAVLDVYANDWFLDQFEEAVTRAGEMMKDPSAAIDHYTNGIGAIQEGYARAEWEGGGLDTTIRRTHLRTLMLWTAMLTGDTQAAYDLAGEVVPVHDLTVAEMNNRPDLFELAQARSKARQARVLLASLEQNTEIDFKQLEHGLRSFMWGEMGRDFAGRLNTPKPPLLRYLKVVDRAIQEREVV